MVLIQQRMHIFTPFSFEKLFNNKCTLTLSLKLYFQFSTKVMTELLCYIATNRAAVSRSISLQGCCDGRPAAPVRKRLLQPTPEAVPGEQT